MSGGENAAAMVVGGAVLVGALVAVALLGRRATHDVSSSEDTHGGTPMDAIDKWPQGQLVGISRERLKTGVHPKLLGFWAWWNVNGAFPVIVISGVRTNEQQAELYAQGRTKPGNVVTNARNAHESPHGQRMLEGKLVGCATDAYPANFNNVKKKWELELNTSDPRWAVLIAAGEAHGLESGSRWPNLKDWPHLEVKGWRSLAVPNFAGAAGNV